LTLEKLNRRTQRVEENDYQLTWQRYLGFILPKESDLREQLNRMEGIDQAIELQRAFEFVLSSIRTREFLESPKGPLFI